MFGNNPVSEFEETTSLSALLESLLPHVGITVCWACRQYRQYPAPDIVSDLTQEVVLSLIQNDFQRLRSFAHRSTGKTWLRVVVLHQVGRHFKRQKLIESLEYLPEAVLPPQLPEQEERVLSRERGELLCEIQHKLTSREQALLKCLRSGFQDEEIAQRMGIQVRSIQRTKCILLQKVRDALEANSTDRAEP